MPVADEVDTWIQCFTLYLAVNTEKEPNRIKPLLAYMNTTVKASMKYEWSSWTEYDQNYHQEAADSGLKDKSKVDPTTYTQCFINACSHSLTTKIGQSIDHATDVHPCEVQSP